MRPVQGKGSETKDHPSIFERGARLGAYLAAHPLQGSAEAARAVSNRFRGRSALRDELPWMPWGAIRFLEELVSSKSCVFEYGSGGSTLFFAWRAASVTSVEHDASWGETVRGALQRGKISNADFRVVAPELEADPEYASVVSGYDGMSFRKYARTICEFPDGHFDLVVVDGRARNSCVREALAKIKPGGVLLLDNSERDKYRAAREMMSKSPHVKFYGLNPYQLDPGETTAWKLGDS